MIVSKYKGDIADGIEASATRTGCIIWIFKPGEKHEKSHGPARLP
jgi:hypothetical protein